MDPELQKLVDAPLADPLRLNIPGGRDNLPPKPRSGPTERLSDAERKARGYLTTGQVKERQAKAHNDRLAELYDYYAKTDIPAERVAKHMGVYRMEEDGLDEDKKPKFKRVLDVETVQAQLNVRRK